MKYLLIIFFLSTIQFAHSKDHKRKPHKRNVCRDVVIPQGERTLKRCLSKSGKRKKKFCCNKAAGFRKGLMKMNLYPAMKGKKKCGDHMDRLLNIADSLQDACDE